VLAATALLALAVPFSLLALLVARAWSPLQHADLSIESSVHRAALATPWLVDLARGFTFLGNTATRLALGGLVVLVLLVRKAWRLGLFLGATALAGGGLDTLVKTIVDRTRPVLPDPVATAGGASFPSGHAMGAMVLYGALLLVVLSLLPRRARGWAWGVAAVVVVGVGCSRVVLGVHYPSDVVGGWVLGLAWLAIATAVFNVFRAEIGARKVPVSEGVAPEETTRLR
jgi:membrane-associated phospholipid phosphatase